MSHNERSRHITHGVARAPNRAMYYALGYQEADFDNPMIGVANGHSTITPCNSGLQRPPMPPSRPSGAPRPIRRCSARPPFPTACPWAPRA